MLAPVFSAWFAVQSVSRDAPSTATTPGKPPSPLSPAPTTPAVLLDRIAAVVGDEVVLESEVRRLVEVEVVPRRPGEVDTAYRDRVLNDRIDEILRETQLRRTAGVEPDPRDVDTRYRELVARVEKERGESFDEVLKRARASADEVRSWIRRGLALETYVKERISPTIKIADAELSAYYDGPFRREAKERGLATMPPLAEVADQLRELVRERRLDEEITRWTASLRAATRVLIYRR
jgi:hypothetical protein